MRDQCNECPEGTNSLHFYADPTNADALAALPLAEVMALAKRVQAEGLLKPSNPNVKNANEFYGRLLKILDGGVAK